MTPEENRKRQAELRRKLDTVIGGRYVEVTETADGIAVITADLYTPEDIKNITRVINKAVRAGDGYKELSPERWKIKPIDFNSYRHVICQAPLTRRRFVTINNRAPLMEVRILNA